MASNRDLPSIHIHAAMTFTIAIVLILIFFYYHLCDAQSISPTPTFYPSPSAWPKRGGRCEGEKNYTIRFHYVWEPIQYDRSLLGGPGSKAGFSFLLCAAHQTRFALWRKNSYIRDGFKDVIDSQNFTAIKDVLDKHLEKNKSILAYTTSQTNGNGIRNYVESPGVDQVNITVDGSQNASFIACFASLNPSPDWFVGFSLFDTCQPDSKTGNFRFIDNAGNFTLRPWDAGYDIEESLSDTTTEKGLAEPIHLKTNDQGPYGSWELFDPKVAASPSPTSTPFECFPSNAEVHSIDGTKIRMDELKIGDEILTRNRAFSQVYMFSHQNFYRKSWFIRLHFANNKTLAASSGHYVPLHTYTYASSSRSRYVAIDEIKVGDAMVDRFGRPLKVNRIDEIEETGLFNPHTLQGELVVNDVLVSSYTSACTPNAASAALAFPRSLYRWRLAQLVHRWTAYFFDINKY